MTQSGPASHQTTWGQSEGLRCSSAWISRVHQPEADHTHTHNQPSVSSSLWKSGTKLCHFMEKQQLQGPSAGLDASNVHVSPSPQPPLSRPFGLVERKDLICPLSPSLSLCLFFYMHLSRLHCKILKLIVYHHHHHSTPLRTKVKNSKNIQGLNSESIDITGPNSSRYHSDRSSHRSWFLGPLVPSSLNDVQRQEVRLQHL